MFVLIWFNSDFIFRNDSEGVYGCEWEGNSYEGSFCKPIKSLNCANYNYYSCYYYMNEFCFLDSNNQCKSRENIKTCSDIKNDDDCENFGGCDWYKQKCEEYGCSKYTENDCGYPYCILDKNKTCVSFSSCEDIWNKTACDNYGCMWSSSSEKCYNGCDSYYSKSDCPSDNCVWHNNNCYNKSISCEYIYDRIACLYPKNYFSSIQFKNIFLFKKIFSLYIG